VGELVVLLIWRRQCLVVGRVYALFVLLLDLVVENLLPVGTKLAPVHLALSISFCQPSQPYSNSTDPITELGLTHIASMPTLSTLPIELQVMIVKRADKKAVLALNSVSRTLYSLVQPVLASIYSSDRTFPFSEEGMAALLSLSKRESWAPSLQTLIIVHEDIAEPACCHKMLFEALRNFGAFGKLTALEISLAQYYGSFAYTKSFLEKILKSALEAKLPINSIIFQLGVDPDIDHFGIQRRAWTQPSLVQDEFLTEVTEIWALMNALPTMAFPEIGRGFRFFSKGCKGTQESPSVVYNPQKHSLIGMHLKFDDWKMVLRWLPAPTTLEVVTLFDCDIEFRVFTDLIVKPSLRALSIEDVTLVRNFSMAGHWQFPRLNNYSWHLGMQNWAAVFDGLTSRSLQLAAVKLPSRQTWVPQPHSHRSNLAG
jgi:hypothetical protein